MYYVSCWLPNKSQFKWLEKILWSFLWSKYGGEWWFPRMYVPSQRRTWVWTLLMVLPGEAFLFPSGLCNAFRLLPLGTFPYNTGLIQCNTCPRSMALLGYVTLSLHFTCSHFWILHLWKYFRGPKICCQPERMELFRQQIRMGFGLAPNLELEASRSVYCWTSTIWSSQIE